jgi:hypothetical protein
MMIVIEIEIRLIKDILCRLNEERREISLKMKAISSSGRTYLAKEFNDMYEQKIAEIKELEEKLDAIKYSSC